MRNNAPTVMDGLRQRTRSGFTAKTLTARRLGSSEREKRERAIRETLEGGTGTPTRTVPKPLQPFWNGLEKIGAAGWVIGRHPAQSLICPDYQYRYLNSKN